MHPKRALDLPIITCGTDEFDLGLERVDFDFLQNIFVDDDDFASVGVVVFRDGAAELLDSVGSIDVEPLTADGLGLRQQKALTLSEFLPPLQSQSQKIGKIVVIVIIAGALRGGQKEELTRLSTIG